MSSQWTNKYAIMRDLSMAQGCVPVPVEGAVAPEERPRGPDVVEETEEEYFRNCSGGGDFNAPDLGMIKQMLNMVHDFDSNTPKMPENVGNMIQIIKGVNSLSSAEAKHTNNVSRAVPAKKSRRNVAMTSIETLLNKMTDSDKENKQDTPVKLLKPVDLKQSESDLKVNKWLDKNKPKETSSLAYRLNTLSLNPSLMFRRKQVNVDALAPNQAEKSAHKEVSTMQYVPSKQANEYYKKYEERSQVKQIVQEDIWMKAERQMREIDARRKLEAEKLAAEKLEAEKLAAEKLAAEKLEAEKLEAEKLEAEMPGAEQAALVASSSADQTPITSWSEAEFNEPTDRPSLPHGLDAVLLPMYRHLLTGPCVVCEVLCKKEPSSDDSICDE